MTLPNNNIPLSVRMYRHDDPNAYENWFELRLTRYIDDLTFKQVVPGGCESAKLVLHIPSDRLYPPDWWGELYNSVQIIDDTSAEVVWEGRVEDPAMQTGEDTWELGLLGVAVASTDVTIPMLYADNELTDWDPLEADAFQHEKDEPTRTLVSRLVEGFSYSAGTSFGLWHYTGAVRCGAVIARNAVSYDGSGPNTTEDNRFEMLLNWPGVTGTMDVTNFEAATIYKANTIGVDFTTSQLKNHFYYDVRHTSTTYAIASGLITVARFHNPRVIGMRVDRYGNVIVTPAPYNQGDYVKVSQVVEDVVGRFLNNNWDQGLVTTGISNQSEFHPERGQVGGEACYIDTSNVIKIINLKYPDGADAKKILSDMMSIQTEAYWAIWPSRFLQFLYSKFPAINEPGWPQKSQFEWRKWPTSPNYVVRGIDGMSSQWDGEDVYNRVVMQVQREGTDASYALLSTYAGDAGLNSGGMTADESGHPYNTWHLPDLRGKFTRSLFVKRETPIATGEVDDEILAAEAVQHRLKKNTGTLTLKRPIFMTHYGSQSYQGYVGRLQPWEIKPGFVVRVRDIWPDSNAGEFTFDDEPLPWGHDNCTYRVVSTTYSSADNSCVLELDTLPKWSLPTQINKPSSGGSIVTK